MTIQAMLIFWERKDLTPLSKLLGIALGDSSGDGNFSWRSEYLTEFCCCEVEQLDEAFDELVHSGLITLSVQHLNGATFYKGRIVEFPDWSVKREQDAYRKKPIHPRIRKQVFERDEFACVYCGIRKDLSVDHVIPEKRGGTQELSNLVTACRPCNSAKQSRTPEEWAEARANPKPKSPPWA